MLLASIRERQREIAVMRAIGAPPWFILLLIEVEGLLITVSSLVSAILILALSTSMSKDFLAEQFSLFIDGNLLTSQSISYLMMIVAGSLTLGLIPGMAAYRRALQQQLT
ncbi:MAG TPA: hypothetical protein DCZ03_15560 [Gammaproteobacteria bacterium]|nr:hypothetical protein [Gammaproteobacteria bacterium]